MNYAAYLDHTCVSDETQDPTEDEHQLSRIKDWISSNQFETVEVTDVLGNFPDVSVVSLVSLRHKKFRIV